MMSIFHVSRAEAWNMPLVEARALHTWHLQCAYGLEPVRDGYIAQEAKRER
jgi:hypothetical protein